jgi:ubiquinone/menaquinone biosynthesis C-methylase UbiE
VPSIELAGLCDGHIIAVDNDQESLDSFKAKLAKSKVSGRIEIVNRSIHDLNFPDESFDIVWCEGALFVLGFKKSLKKWRRFLKPDGYLTAHDEKGNVQSKIKQIANCGYNLIDHFVLDKNTWWEEYYSPLEKRIQELREKYADDKDALTVLDREYSSEVGFFKKHPSRCESVCFVMKKG